MKQQQTQAPSLLKGHPYRHSTQGVDVRDTWRKFGWEPKQTPAPQQNAKEKRRGSN